MKKIYYWGPVIIWMAVIFFLSSQSAVKTSEVKSLDFLIHKTAHIIEYAILSTLFFRATKNWKTSLILTIIYALTDEIHQSFVVTREGKIRDIAIDAFGGSIGLWVQKYLLQIQMLKPKKSEKNSQKV